MRQTLRALVTHLAFGQGADATADDVAADFTRASGRGGWWIITEVSVAYETHQCPVRDIAGWRKERVPNRPTGIIDTAPDWVCEIVSPGRKRKDTLDLFLLLQRHRVPYHWIIWPEDRVLIAHQLDGAGDLGHYPG